MAAKTKRVRATNQKTSTSTQGGRSVHVDRPCRCCEREDPVRVRGRERRGDAVLPIERGGHRCHEEGDQVHQPEDDGDDRREEWVHPAGQGEERGTERPQADPEEARHPVAGDAVPAGHLLELLLQPRLAEPQRAGPDAHAGRVANGLVAQDRDGAARARAAATQRGGKNSGRSGWARAAADRTVMARC